jgi:thiol-disulfide isomerase/thioredoxin
MQTKARDHQTSTPRMLRPATRVFRRVFAVYPPMTGRFAARAVPVVGTTVVCMLVTSCSHQQPRYDERIQLPPEPLIGETFSTLEQATWFNSGEITSTRAYRGKVMLIEFGFTTCPSCQKLAPKLKEVLARYEKEPLVPIEVMYGGNDDETSVRDYIKKSQMKHPVVLDVGGKLTDKLGIEGFPTFFVVDEKGTILWWKTTSRIEVIEEWIIDALAQAKKRAEAASRRL